MLLLLFHLKSADSANAEDWLMFGRDATRNAVSREKNPPVFWQLEGAPVKWKGNRVIERAKTAVNIQWTAQLGTMCLSAPVVSDGLVWVGTNHVQRSQEKKVELKQGAVLQCRRASDGKLLYEYVSPKLSERYQDASFWQGLACSPLVTGERLWFVSNRCEVICLDISPLAKTHEKVKELRVVWKVDMRKEFGVYPRVMYMGPGRLCSIGRPYRGHIYVTTGNGSNMFQRNVVAPKAPSLVCLNQETGEARWTDNTPGKNILQGSFGSPLVVEIRGRGQVIAPQGDGWLRSFDALSGELIWGFDINPKTAE
jgi:outer membrane protein assembly factor BamB